jgi:hypothetical protein
MRMAKEKGKGRRKRRSCTVIIWRGHRADDDPIDE